MLHNRKIISSDLNHDLNQAKKVTKSDLFTFLIFECFYDNDNENNNKNFI